MPSIPSSKRQIKEQVFQRPGTSTQGPKVGSFDGSATANMNKALTGVQKVYGDYRDKVDKSELDGFKTRLRDKQNQLTHNPETGFLNVRGKDTLLQSDDYNKEYEDFAKAEIDALGSDRAKDAATLMAADVGVNYNKQLMAHTNKEMEQHDNEQTKANLSSLKNTAILNYQTDPSGIPKAVKEQEVIFREFADRKGMSKKEADLMVKEGESDLLGGVIYQAIADDKDRLASQLFDDARKKGKFVAEDLLKLERSVDQSNLLGEAQRQTGSFMQKHPNKTDGLAAARAALKDDPKLRDATVQRMKMRYSEQKVVKDEASKELFQGLASRVEQKHDLAKLQNESQWFELKMNERAAIEKRAKQVAANKYPDKSNLDVITKLSRMAAHPTTRQDFIDYPLELDRAEMTNSDSQLFIKMQAKMMKGDDKAAKALYTNIKIAGNVAKQLEVPDKHIPTFENELNRRTSEWQENNPGKQLQQKEVEEMGKDMGKEFVTGSTWYTFFLGDETTPRYKLTEEQAAKVAVQEAGEAKDKATKATNLKIADAVQAIPAKMREQVIKSLVKRGRPANPKNILDLYNYRQGKLKPKSNSSNQIPKSKGSTGV